MPLEVDGEPILTLGDFTQLIAGLRDGTQPVGVLGAWRNFEEVDPQALHNCLTITCRTNLVDGPKGDAALAILDAACERLEALPGVLAR